MRVIIPDNVDFETAQNQLREVGIILQKRTHSKGGYVCQASRDIKIAFQLTGRLQMFLRNSKYRLSGSI